MSAFHRFRFPPCESTCMRSFSSSPVIHSRVGKRPLRIPDGVTISLIPRDPSPPFPKSNRQAIVTGPLGKLHLPLPPFASLTVTLPEQQGDRPVAHVRVKDPEEKSQRAEWGTMRALLANCVEGVSEGHTVPIRLVGVGYRAALEDKAGKKVLTLKLGHSHSVVVAVPDGVTVTVPNPQRIVATGIELAAVTQFAAKIRSWRPPEPYNQKGVFVGDETIKKKEGKKR